MASQLLTRIALGCALAVGGAGAVTVGAVTAALPAQAAGPAALPRGGYNGATWVNGRGCYYYRGSTGSWLPALTPDGKPDCEASTPIGAVSPLTGFPVPPGYRVAWTDGRLNPLRGPIKR